MSQVDTMKTAGQAPALPDVLELATLLRPTWARIDADLRHSGVPLCEGEAPPADPPPADPPADPPKDDEPKSYDADYVRNLRRENAAARKRAQEAEAKAKELEDRDKSEQQKLTEKAAADAKRADEAEARLLRADVAADKGVPAKLAKFLTGSTKEELEKAADELLAELKDGGNGRTTFDGGSRETPPPAGDLDSAIRRAGGRT